MPDLQDLQIHASVAIAAGAVFIPICTIITALRFYTRRYQGTKIGTDDWTTLAALVRSCDYSTSNRYGTLYTVLTEF